jgi:arylsulfatase A-like enzyme
MKIDRLSRRPVLSARWIIVFFVSLLPTSLCRGQDIKQKNVVFIAIDDLRPELGCYGHSHAISPNLDRLAATGVLFHNHFVQVATCGASRYAMLTGRSPQTSKVTRNNNAFFQGKSALTSSTEQGASSMPELFRRNGYKTVGIGKISHTADGRVYQYNGQGDGRLEMPGAWDVLDTPYGSWKRGWGIFFAYAGGRHREDGNGHLDLMEFSVQHDEALPDGLLAQTAVRQLRQLKKGSQPFFLAVGFFKPHLPFVAPRQDWEALRRVQVPGPPQPDVTDSRAWHRSGEFYKYTMPFQKIRPLAAADQVEARRAYLACVRYVDRQVGKVLNAIDELGLTESTIVVVWGDHGWHLGDSALWGKHTPLERAVRSTLIIRAPTSIGNGKSCRALVDSIDIYPTLVDLCDLGNSETQFPLDGVSFRSLLDDPELNRSSSEVRTISRSYWSNAVSVRSKTHRLISWTNEKKQRFELYDITASPDPIKNLAKLHPEIVRELVAHVETTTAIPVD